MRPRVLQTFAAEAPPTDLGSYWQEVSPQLVVGSRGPTLPAQEADVERALGSSSKWAALSEDARKRALAGGVVVTPLQPAPTSLGAYYDALDDAHVPFVVTMDTFFALARACLGAALDEAERMVLAPALPKVLGGVLSRLTSERNEARVDLRVAYDVAIATLGVSSRLIDPNVPIPADVQAIVTFELDHVRAHAGVAESLALGRTLDYTAFEAHQGLTESDPRLPQYRAVRWLAQAAWVLARRSDSTRGIDVAEMRTQTRASLLVARALKAEPQLAQTWARVEDVFTLVYGPPDDLGARELGRLVKNAGVDLSDGQAFVNVATVDRVRRAAVNTAPADVMDLGAVALAEGEAPPVTFRLLGPSAPPDAVVLGRLVSPFVGAWSDPEKTDAPRLRTLPSALDVGVLLGSKDARTALTEDGADRYAGFSDALTRATRRRMPEDSAARHGSFTISYLDAIATYLAPSAAAVTQPGDAAAQGRRKLAVALAAWAGLRHEGVPFAHEVGAQRLEVFDTTEVRRAPSMVEPHPEALAKLLAAARQLDAAFSAMGAFSADSPAKQALTLFEALLVDALRAAVIETSCQPTTAAPVAWPERILAIEARLGIMGAAPRLAVVAVDATGRVLEEGTGPIDEAVMLMRTPEPTAHASVYVGAFIGHYETSSTLRRTDHAWQLSFTSPPARPPYMAPLFVPKE